MDVFQACLLFLSRKAWSSLAPGACRLFRYICVYAYVCLYLWYLGVCGGGWV